ncbi:hypothetical protein AMECASPLE_024646 [Ameca splendens]|uniref:Uncharacterized protein n=1 Tax=Ameca splendens TaxID=208324 RepID=A0ABV0Z3C1_9TELE
MPSDNICYNKDKSDELNFDQNTNKCKILGERGESMFNQPIPTCPPDTLNKAEDWSFEISRAGRFGSISEGGPHLGATCSPCCCSGKWGSRRELRTNGRDVEETERYPQGQTHRVQLGL